MKLRLIMLVCIGSMMGLCGCQAGGASGASTTNGPISTYASKSPARQDSRTVAQNSKSGSGTKLSGFRKASSSDQKLADVKSVGYDRRLSSRAPTVKPAVHASEPDPQIPAGEAGTAAQPQGNFLSRLLPGNKEPAKRMPLPLADGSSKQSTNDELFSGF